VSIMLTGPNYRKSIINQGMYSDNTPMVKVDDFGGMVLHADTMTIRHTSMAEFVTAMFLVDAIRSNAGCIKNLILPYIPGARQDRSNFKGDVLFTLASVARMLNERTFQRVVVLDPHSNVAGALVHRMVVYPATNVIDRLSGNGYDGVIAPDNGARARAAAAASVLGVPLFQGGKTRDVSTGRLSGFTLDKIPQGHYLVVDDICDGGGTFTGLAAKVHEQGSTADLFVSHGIFSKGTSALRQFYKTIYTTDSLSGGIVYPITYIPVVNDMENYYE
jgi:ribose-phosphate pyrophosphokinase